MPAAARNRLAAARRDGYHALRRVAGTPTRTGERIAIGTHSQQDQPSQPSSSTTGQARRWLHRLLAPAVSAALLAWLIWRISPEKLLAAAAELDVRLLVPATLAMVVALYLWDAVCLRTLFSTPEHPLRYGTALASRGRSYVAGAINYELGQAALAWELSRRQGVSLLSTLTRSALLAYHDVAVLLGLGMAGTFLSNDPRVEKVRWFCSVGLCLIGALALLPFFLPQRYKRRLPHTRWGAWLESWSWARSARLAAARVVYFLILVVYAAVALEICRIPLDFRVVLSTIPLVMLADGLPSVSGLGTRETALQLLLPTEEPAVLVALSLVWTTVLVLGRATIGLAYLWAAGQSDKRTC